MILGTLIELPFFKPQVIQYIKLDFFSKICFCDTSSFDNDRFSENVTPVIVGWQSSNRQY